MKNKFLFNCSCVAFAFFCLLAKAEALPKKIIIAGDSTAASYNMPDQQGWGAILGDYFDPQQASIVNRAKGGRSSRTFITEGLWQSLIDETIEGDIVIIQFGHNDASKINDDSRARGSLPGIGEESIDIDNLLTKQKETVYTFGYYIRKMIKDVRAKNATPILLSLTQRNVWQGEHLERGGNYNTWLYELAIELNTQFIDVNNLVADKLEARGQVEMAKLYIKDSTHFNLVGAQMHAETVLAALKGLHPDIFSSLLNEKGKALTTDSSSWLRLPFPADRNLRSVFLIGDSTVRNGGGDGANGEWGWGDFLFKNFETKKFNIVNRAVGGTSSRTFYTSGYWQSTLNMMRPGDILLMQFGHNDAAAINDANRARGSLPGVADNVELITNQVTGKLETVYSYGGYLRHFVGEARARGVTTVICSPVPRKLWRDKHIFRTENSYPDWARLVALQSGSAFVDLNAAIADKYDSLGPKKVEEFFADEHTHTNKAGAEINAEFVAKQLKPILGL